MEREDDKGRASFSRPDKTSATRRPAWTEAGGTSRRSLRTPETIAVVGLLLAGCGGSRKPAEEPPGERAATSPAHAPQTAKTGPPGGPPAGPSAKPPTGPPPELRLALQREPEGRRGLVVSVQNRDMHPVKLDSALHLERAQGERFVPVEGEATLAADCGAPARSCLELAPGGELRPTPLSAPPDLQCCQRCDPLPAGRYRVSLRGCEASFTLTSEPLTVAE